MKGRWFKLNNQSVVVGREKIGLFTGLFVFLKRIAILVIYVIFLAPVVLTAIIGSIFLMFSRTKLSPETIKIENLKPGDIILTGSNGLASLPIKIANIITNGLRSKYWTHVAFHVGDGALIEAQPSGVRDISIVSYIEKGSLIKVFRHKYLNPINNPDVFENLVQSCKDISYYKNEYGFLALIYYALSIGMPDVLYWVFNDSFYEKLFCIEDKYFCSELAAEAYRKAGYPISQFEDWRVKPSDFLKNPMFVEIHTKV